jgi:hypothetical protein
MLTEDNHPFSPIGGSLVGQNSDLNRSKEFSLGNNFLSIPSAVGTWLGECQKGLRKLQ